ncbi:LuxR family transcriptional regulator [Aeromicrobium camelliae]|uniref:LuxR family transcriptional regulator n=1 Tax=Aeromicrobium camelliae TaxID=1538144 RepID=A0A3N6WQN6_9ACTN|nr:helix-turn-helix transcriptional regulator [Aeromicrobium camelliae]RQN09769.1 LuxR family transcriptional regulator [Aeromicrobium camelliae]
MPTPRDCARRTVEHLLIDALETRHGDERSALILLGEPGNGARTVATVRVPAEFPEAQVAASGRWRPNARIQCFARPEDVPAAPPPSGTCTVVATTSLNRLPAWLTTDELVRRQVLTVDVLSIAELHDVLVARLDAPVDLAAVRAIGHAAGFVPAVVTRLASAARDASLLVLLDGRWQLVGALTSLLCDVAIQNAVMALPHATTAARLALAEPIRPSRLTSHEREVAEEWLALGILRRRADDHRLEFRAPFVADALRALNPPARVAQAYRAALADEPSPNAVRWALRNGHHVDDATIDAILERTMQRHEWSAAVELNTLAIEVGERDGASATRRCTLYLQAARAWRFLPDADEAETALDEAAALLPEVGVEQASALRTRAATLRADLLHYQRNDLDGALAVLERARGEATDRRERGKLAAHRLLHLTYGGRLSDAAAEMEDDSGDLRFARRGLRARVTVARALSEAARGTPRRGLARVRRAGVNAMVLPSPEPWFKEELRGAYFVCAISSEGPARLVRLARHLEDTRHGGYHPDQLTYHVARAAWHLATGEVRLAHRIALAASGAVPENDPSGMEQALVALLAETSALLGEQNAAGEFVRRFPLIPPRSSAAVAGSSQARVAAARLALDLPRAASTTLDEAQAFVEDGHAGFAAETLHAAIRFGRRRAARALLALRDSLDGELHALRLAHAEALLAEDAVTLLDVADRFADAGLRLLAAEAATQAGAAPTAPAAIRRAAAARALRAMDELGLTAHPLLHRLPGMPNGETLTPREQQVSELIAAGLTNAEIAGRLHLSRRTVEGHIARLYRKTGQSRRAPARRGPAAPATS